MTTIRARKFTMYTDPGHGWVKVPKKLLQQLGIAQQITSYSYMKGEYAYLEEDLDYSTFMHAYYDLIGRRTDLIIKEQKHTNRSSRIRSYECYCPPTSWP